MTIEKNSLVLNKPWSLVTVMLRRLVRPICLEIVPQDNIMNVLRVCLGVDLILKSHASRPCGRHIPFPTEYQEQTHAYAVCPV